MKTSFKIIMELFKIKFILIALFLFLYSYSFTQVYIINYNNVNETEVRFNHDNSAINFDITISTLSDPGGTLSWSYCMAGAFISCPNVSDFTIIPSDSPVSLSTSAGNITLTQNSTARTLNVEIPLSEIEPAELHSFTIRAVIGTDLVGDFVAFNLNIRNPLDLNFVLDRSGSMGSDVVGFGGDRLDLLKDAVVDFITFYQGLSPQDDQIRITYFDSNLQPVSTNFNSFVSLGSTSHTDVYDDLLSIDHGGSTAMGSGLLDAESKLISASRAHSILLFTDGQQNVPPEVDNFGMNYIDPPNPSNPIQPTDIKYFTIGIDISSATYSTTLMNLANENGGHYVSVSAGSIPLAFRSQFINLLKEFSPQIINEAHKNLRNINPSYLLDSFALNKNVNKLFIDFLFETELDSNELNQFLEEIVISKNGNHVPIQFESSWVGNTSNNILLSYDFINNRTFGVNLPFSSEGQWSIKLNDFTSTEIALNEVNVTSIADDHRLKYSYTYGSALPRVNKTINPRVELKWMGDPVINATVKAKIKIPGLNIGDYMSQDNRKITLSNNLDAGSPGVQKFNQIYATDSTFRNALVTEGILIDLPHIGSGIYQSSFSQLDTKGNYDIIYLISGQDSLIGEYQRLAKESFHVIYSDVDLGASQITAKVVDNQLVVKMTPISSEGKYHGPVYGETGGFSVDNPDIKIENVTEFLDGTYELTFSGDFKSTTSLSILGQEIYNGPLDKIDKDKCPPWLWWLIAILILMGLLWYFIWRRP